MKKTIAATIVILIVISVVVIYQFKDNSLTKLQEANTIRIGYSIEAPFSFVEPDGSITGLATMEARAITKRLGIKNIQWRLVEFGSLISELEADKIDVIAAGMYITKERAQRVRFSDPTFHVKLGLAVAKGNPKKLCSYEQLLASKELKIAVLAGSVEETLLVKTGFTPDRLISVPDVKSGKIAVATCMADALAVALPTLRWMISNDKTNLIEIAKNFKQPELVIKEKQGYGAFQFRIKDKQLQAAWNEQLKTFIGSTEQLEIYNRFGFSKEELPNEMTTEMILNQDQN